MLATPHCWPEGAVPAQVGGVGGGLTGGAGGGAVGGVGGAVLLLVVMTISALEAQKQQQMESQQQQQIKKHIAICEQVSGKGGGVAGGAGVGVVGGAVLLPVVKTWHWRHKTQQQIDKRNTNFAFKSPQYCDALLVIRTIPSA